MKKGKYSITLGAVAAIAFVLSILDLGVAMVLVLGYALIAEQDEWLNKQTLQAFYLGLSAWVIKWAVNAFFSFFEGLFGGYNSSGIYTVLYDINSVVIGLVEIAFIVFAIIAIVNVLKDKDANLPLVKMLAEKSLGIYVKRQPVYPAYPPAANYGAPTAPAQPYAPAPAPVPASAPVSAPAPAPAATPAPAPVAEAPSAPASDVWTCPSCGSVTAGNFCGKCGTPKPKI